MPYQEQKGLFRQRTSTFAQATTQNFILLEGEKWWEVDAANLTTGRSKTGKDGRVVNDVIVGTAFNDLPFDPTGTGGSGPGDPTNLSITNRTATGLDVASSTGNDATVPLATETLAGLQTPSNRAKAEGAVQAVALTPPSGWSTNSTNTDGSVTLTLGLPSGFSLPSNASQANWDTAYSMRGQWSGGATGLNAATGRASLELGSAALAAAGDFASSAQGALAATAVQPPGLASTLAAYLTTASAASSYQPLSANLTALAANNAAYYLARSNHSGTQALSTISGLGTGIANALAVNAGAAGAPVLFDGAGGTPSSLALVNATGLPLATGVTGLLPVANGGTGTAAPGLIAGTHVSISGTWPNQTITVTGGGPGGGGGDALTTNPLSQFAATTSAQLRGVISDETGAGLLFFQGGDVGTPSAGVLTNCTGLPLGTGITGLGTGIATALAINAGSPGAPVLLNGAGGTPSSLTLTNATGLPFGAGISDKPTTLAGYGITDGFTEAQVRATPITGFAAAAGTVAATDSILQAIQKLVGNIADRALSGLISSSGLTMASSRLVGRSTASTGAVEELTVGSRLTLAAGELNATTGSVTAGITGAAQVTNMVQLTQANYDAITSPSATTLYVIIP